MTWQKDDFWITTNPAALDLAFIHQFLTTSYWAEGIPIETVQRSIEGSLPFGIFHAQQQIGFARLITDKTTFAYLADVFIDEAWRGKGLSKWLLSVITVHPELQGLRRWMLATRDAHGLYRQFGFTEIANPERMMQRHIFNVYKKTP